jgi:hypothetical protein
MPKLPHSHEWQYISHLYHGQKLIPRDLYQPMSDWDYAPHDREKFTKILLDNVDVIENKRILDLGCHHGFLSYATSTLGCTTATGLNAREHPLTVGRYFLQQMNVSNVDLVQGNIEDFDLLKTLCSSTDTVIMSEVIEHLTNPCKVFDVITNSSVSNIVIKSQVIVDDNQSPKLYYYMQDTDSDFHVFHNNRDRWFGSTPNRRFLEYMLYYSGWNIVKYEATVGEFNPTWFAIPNLEPAPTLCQVLYITAQKRK